VAEDYAKATAAPRFITIGEKEYRVGKYGPRDIGDLEAWLKTQVPDPRLKARTLCEGLPDAVALEIWRDLSMEAASWPPSIDSRQGNKLLIETWEGNAMVVWVSLRRHNGGFTLEDAKRLTKDDDSLATQVVTLSQPEPDWSPKAVPETMPTPEE
jgi:hypothetical protein